MRDLRLRAPTGPIQIRPGKAGELIVLVPYTPQHVAKIKTLAGRQWHHDEKHWTVPHTDGTLAHLLALFTGEPVEVDPSLGPVRAPVGKESSPEVSHSKLLDRTARSPALPTL